jgi:hypothetical protein
MTTIYNLQKEQVLNDFKRYNLIAKYFEKNQERLTLKNIQYLQEIFDKIDDTPFFTGGYQIMGERIDRCIIRKTEALFDYLGRLK